MSIKFIAQYPVWLLLAALVVAAAITLLLYFRDQKLAEIRPWKIRLMMALRFLALFLIAVLLLGPMLQQTKQEIEKPVVLFAQDNSSSLLYAADSTKMKTQWPQTLQELQNTLSPAYDFRLYNFGESLRRDTTIDYSDQQTDFSRLFSQINNLYAGKNLGAVVVASDGIYTQGASPVYAASVANYPVYTVALGDTAPRPDAAISDLQINKIAYLGNKFPVRIYLNATELKGQEMTVQILHKGESVFSRTITPGSNAFSEVLDASLEAKEAGNQTYTVKVTRFSQEKNQMNNTRSFVIEVIDSKQKILMLADGIHPDAGALRSTLSQIRSYTFTFRRLDDFSGDISPYNLVIFHNLPSNRHSLKNIMQQSSREQIPRLFIAGPEANWSQLSAYTSALRVAPDGNATDQAYPGLNESFTAFRVTDEMREFFEVVPPLNVPFGNYSLQQPFEVLAYQKLKGIQTERPLIAIAEAQNETPKTGVITGTGLWHWRMYDYVEHKTHRNFDAFINKIIQFLALKAQKEHISAKHPPVFPENENLYFEVQVYNEVYELVKEADVEMQMTGEDGEEYNFTLSPVQSNTGVMFVLNAGVFPRGNYSYTITADIGDKVYEKEGAFKVLPVKIETINTRADHRVLYQLANQNQGRMFTPENVDSLKNALDSNNQIQQVVHTSQELTEIIHWKWLFFIILLLLGAEWFLRKFEGTY